MWIDAFEPSDEERRRLESGAQRPRRAREEVQEIEPSSRLYAEPRPTPYYMTATILAAPPIRPSRWRSRITFVLSRRALVCLALIMSRCPIRTYSQKLMKNPGSCNGGQEVLRRGCSKRWSIVLRMSLEGWPSISTPRRASSSRSGTTQPAVGQRDLRGGDPLARPWRGPSPPAPASRCWSAQPRGALLHPGDRRHSLRRPSRRRSSRSRSSASAPSCSATWRSIGEHAAFELHQVELPARRDALGTINIEQNRIIKLFSVAAVVLPARFDPGGQHLRRLNFKRVLPARAGFLGYPLALVLMVASAGGRQAAPQEDHPEGARRRGQAWKDLVLRHPRQGQRNRRE